MITLSRDIVRLIQKELGLPEAKRDGILGRNTDSAIRNFLKTNKDKLSSRHADGILGGGRKRIATAFGQLKALERSIDPGIVDGFIGPQTNVALDSLIFLIEHDRKPHPSRDHTIPNASRWPVEGSAEFHQRFGPTGEQNLVSITPAYPHKLAWEPSTVVRTIRCHREVADSLDHVLQHVLQEYGQQRITELGLDLYGGCFNDRKRYLKIHACLGYCFGLFSGKK